MKIIECNVMPFTRVRYQQNWPTCEHGKTARHQTNAWYEVFYFMTSFIGYMQIFKLINMIL